MRSKSISGSFFIISLLLLCLFVSAVTVDELSLHLNSAPQPPLTLTEASIDSEEGILTHNNVYQITVQVTNTRPQKVDGRVEVTAFSLVQSPIVLGHETIDIEPDENALLQFTFSPTFPCANYIFMATTTPTSSTHINERDYIFIDERREFALADCAEELEKGDISEINNDEDKPASSTAIFANGAKDSDNEAKDKLETIMDENEIETVIVPLHPFQDYNANLVLDLLGLDLRNNDNESDLQPLAADIEQNKTILED